MLKNINMVTIITMAFLKRLKTNEFSTVNPMFSKHRFLSTFATLNIKNMLCLVVIGFTLLLLLTAISLVTWPEIECVLLSQVKDLQQLFANTFCLPAPEAPVIGSVETMSTEKLLELKKIHESRLESMLSGTCHQTIRTNIALTTTTMLLAWTNYIPQVYISLLITIGTLKQLDDWEIEDLRANLDAINTELLNRSIESKKTADMLSEQVASGNSVFLQSIFDFYLANSTFLLFLAFLVLFLGLSYFYYICFKRS